MRHEESIIQRQCVAWFRLQYPQLARLLFAVPNGGLRNVRTAVQLKLEGTLAGVSDLILLYPSNGFHALCIEMKTEKGRQQETQKAWQKSVEAAGYGYIICRSVSQFVEEIAKYLKSSNR